MALRMSDHQGGLTAFHREVSAPCMTPLRRPALQCRPRVMLAPHASPVTSGQARRLVRDGVIAEGLVQPSWDGLGGYTTWLRSRGSGPSRWFFLAHEDTAVLRFPDTVTAQRKATECGLPDRAIRVRWPP